MATQTHFAGADDHGLRALLRSAVQEVPRSRFVARGRIERRGMTSATDKAPAPSHNAGGVEVDRDELERSVRAMLEALGEDVHREGLADTPKRVAKAMAFAVRGYGMSAIDAVGNALFHEPGMESDEANAAIEAERAATGAERSGGAADDHLLARHGVVLIRDVPFFSTAEDSLLPFYGRAHVGYVPSKGQIVGLSKVARLAEVFARRLQNPNRLAADIASALHEGAAPAGVRGARGGPDGTLRPDPRQRRDRDGCFAGGNDAHRCGAGCMLSAASARDPVKRRTGRIRQRAAVDGRRTAQTRCAEVHVQIDLPDEPNGRRGRVVVADAKRLHARASTTPGRRECPSGPSGGLAHQLFAQLRGRTCPRCPCRSTRGRRRRSRRPSSARPRPRASPRLSRA